MTCTSSDANILIRKARIIRGSLRHWGSDQNRRATLTLISALVHPRDLGKSQQCQAFFLGGIFSIWVWPRSFERRWCFCIRCGRCHLFPVTGLDLIWNEVTQWQDSRPLFSPSVWLSVNRKKASKQQNNICMFRCFVFPYKMERGYWYHASCTFCIWNQNKSIFVSISHKTPTNWNPGTRNKERKTRSG